MTKIYKSVNDIQKLLASLLASYPSVYLANLGENNSNLDLNAMILVPLIKRSEEFCSDLEDGRLLFTPNFEGHFGEVGELKILSGTNYDNIQLNHISVGANMKYVVYHMNTTVKKTKEPEAYYIIVENFNNRFMFNMNNSLHEAMIYSFTSHLYDMGICPGVLKTFGNYACGIQPNNTMPVVSEKYYSYLVLEKSSITLHDLIRNPLYTEIFMSMNVDDFMNIIIQVAHTLYVMKLHFGIVHFDLHLKNIMLSYIKKKGNVVENVPEEHFSQQYYSAKDLNDTEYICYEIPIVGPDGKNKQIIIQNNGFMVKIIDYCMAISEFSLSMKKQNFGFPINKDVLDKTYWLRQAVLSSDKYSTVSMNFFLYNLSAALYRTYNGYEGQNAEGVNLPPRSNRIRKHAHDISENLKYFMFAINPQFSFDKVSQFMTHSQDPDEGKKVKFIVSNSVRNFADTSEVMELRDVGEITNGKDELILERIWNFLREKNFQYSHGTTYVTRKRDRPVITNNTLCLLVPYATDSQRAMAANIVTNLTPMEKFMNTLFKYNSMCLDKDALKFGELATQLKVKWDGSAENRNQICSGWKVEMAIWDPRHRAGKTWAQDDVKNTSLLYDPTTGGIKKGLTENVIRQAGFLRTEISPDLKHYYMEIYPSRFGTKANTNFRLEPYQIYPKRNIYLSEKSGEFMDKVNIHLIYYENRGMEILYGSRDNPYRAATNVLDRGRPGIIFAGGLYVTRDNMQDLTPDVTEKDFYHPIGFFYSRNDLRHTGTPVPIPNGYRKDFAVLLVMGEQIKFMKYNDFERLHKTVRKPYNVYLKDENGERRMWQSWQSAIMTKNGLPIMANNKKIFYDSALSVGPILVWEGQVIFSKEKMKKEAFHVDLLSEWPNPEKNTDLSLRDEKPPTERVEQGQPYSLYEGASDNSMYFTTMAEKSEDPYHMRDSNKVTTYSALCQTYDNKMLMIQVEGGIMAPGLDRSQFASLVAHYNVRYAVSFGSGHTTNAVYRKQSETATWMSANPYSNGVGLLIGIRQKNELIGR